MEPKLHDSYRSLEEDRLRRYYSCRMSQRFIRYRPQLKPLAAIYPEILCLQSDSVAPQAVPFTRQDVAIYDSKVPWNTHVA